MSERDVQIINMGLHKYKLKRKVVAVMAEIDLELQMLDKIRKSVLKVNCCLFTFESNENK